MKRGIIASAFDFLHAGHVLALMEAKSNCDYLIAALHVDPSKERSSKRSPTETLLERFIKLQVYCDLIVPYETEDELLNILKIYKIDVRFLGSDYLGAKYTGDNLNISIHFIERNHNFSSSLIRARLENNK